MERDGWFDEKGRELFRDALVDKGEEIRAYLEEGKIDEDEKSYRLTQLQKLQKGITLRKNRTLLGKNVEILGEGESKKGEQLTGRTGTNKIVNFISNDSLLGRLIKVIIKRTSANSLFGDHHTP